MILDSQILRKHPQLAILDLLAQAAETSIVALCAVHPAVEHELRDDPEPPLERLADCIVEHASALLDAIDRYRPLLHETHSPHCGAAQQNDPIF